MRKKRSVATLVFNSNRSSQPSNPNPYLYASFQALISKPKFYLFVALNPKPISDPIE